MTVRVKLKIVQTAWTHESVTWTFVQHGLNGVAGLVVLKHVAWLPDNKAKELEHDNALVSMVTGTWLLMVPNRIVNAANQITRIDFMKNKFVELILVQNFLPKIQKTLFAQAGFQIDAPPLIGWFARSGDVIRAISS